MAFTPQPVRRRRPESRQPGTAVPTSQRHLAAYLLARETLRRVKAVASMAQDIRRGTSPPGSPQT